MSVSCRIPWLLVCLIVLARPVHAADGSAPSADVVTWAEVRSLVDNDPGSRIAQGRIDLAASELADARRYPNPEVSVRYGRGEPEDEREDDGAVWGVEAEVPIEWIGTRVHRSKSARLGADAASLEARADRLAILHELRSLFVEVAHDQALIDELRAGLVHHDAARDAVRLRVETGDARPIELARMDTSLAEARSELREVEAAAAGRRAALAARLGRDGARGGARDLRVSLDLRERPSVPTLDEALAKADAGSPLLKALETRTLQADAQTAAERNAAFPELGVGGFYDAEIDSRSYGGLVTLEVPLWNWNRAGVRRARAERESAVWRARQDQRAVRERVVALHERLSALDRNVRESESEIVPKSREILRSLEIAYRAGELGLLDVLDARRESIRLATAYLASLAEYHLLLSELHTLLGDADHV